MIYVPTCFNDTVKLLECYIFCVAHASIMLNKAKYNVPFGRLARHCGYFWLCF